MLGGGHDTEPVTELLLLEELLRPNSKLLANIQEGRLTHRIVVRLGVLTST